MKNSVKSDLSIDSLALICLVFLILSSVFPLITLYGNNALLCIVFELLWLCLAFIQSKETICNVINRYWYTIPYALYIVLIPYVCGNAHIGNRYMYTLGLVFGLYIYSYYSKMDNIKIIIKAVTISVPFFAYTFFKTYQVAVTNPWVLRGAYSSSSDVLSRGAGGYHFIYLITIIYAVLINYTISKHKIKMRIIAFLLSILIIGLIIMSNYLTALIICMISTALSLLLKLKRKPALLFTAMLCFILLFSFVSSDDIRSGFLGILTPSGRISNTLSNSNKTMLASFIDEFLRDRWPVNKISIDAYFRNPILGLVTSPIENNGVYDTAYGQHSYIFDTFALYGTLVGVVSVINLIKISKLYPDNLKEYRYIIGVPLILICVFNNITHSIAICATLIMPSIIFCFLSKEE